MLTVILLVKVTFSPIFLCLFVLFCDLQNVCFTKRFLINNNTKDTYIYIYIYIYKYM